MIIITDASPARRPTISCSALQTGLDQITNRLSGGGYNFPRDLLKPRKLEDLTPKDFLGEWQGQLPSGVPFYFHFLSEKDFFYRRPSTDRMGLDGQYSLIIDKTSKQASIIFTIKAVYGEKGERAIAEPTKDFQVTIQEYAYNRMYLRPFSLRKEILQVTPVGKWYTYRYGVLDKPVEWIRDTDHPACHELFDLKKYYDETMKPHIDEFPRAELELKNSLQDLANEIKKVRPELKSKRSEKKEFIERVNREIIDSLKDISEILASKNPLERFIKIIKLEVDWLILVNEGSNILEDIPRLQNKLNALEGKFYPQQQGLVFQREEIKGCRIFRSAYLRLYSELRCKGSSTLNPTLTPTRTFEPVPKNRPD